MPDGSTSVADAEDIDVRSFVDGAVRAGGLGLSSDGSSLELGYAFPGSEGEVTYKGNTFPDGQRNAWTTLSRTG